MALKKIIAHKIEKVAGSVSSLSLSQELWPINAASSQCVNDLKQNALRRAGKEYGCLKKQHSFSQLLAEMYEQKKEFIQFSVEALEVFKRHADEIELSLNHHLVITQESLENSELVSLYFLEQTPSYFINSALELDQNITLNTNIQFGLKINMTDLYADDQDRQSRAITFFRLRGDKQINQFIEEATGFGDKKDISSETEALLQSVNEYAKTLPEDVAAFTKHHVVNYCLEQEQQGQTIALKDLSTELAEQLDEHQSSFASAADGAYTPPPKFDHFALENNQEIKNEMIADKTKLKNFMRISGRNEQLSMSFSSSCLGDSVVYDANSDSLIVKSIPSSLKARLIKLIQQEA